MGPKIIRIYEKPLSDFEKVNARRRAEHQVQFLPQGFTLKSMGRTAELYFREGDRVLEVGCEVSGGPQADALIYDEGLGHWVWPVREPVNDEEKAHIRARRAAWIATTGRRYEVVAAEDLIPHAPAEPE